MYRAPVRVVHLSIISQVFHKITFLLFLKITSTYYYYSVAVNTEHVTAVQYVYYRTAVLQQ